MFRSNPPQRHREHKGRTEAFETNQSMNAETITSRDNSLLKLARSVRDGKTTQYIFVEGLRLCEEALRSGLSLEAVIISEELAAKEKPAAIIASLAATSTRAALVSEKLLESVSYTKTPQGIILLAARPEASEKSLGNVHEHALIVVMHRINNPVNVGAIMRTAEAAGASGIVATAH